MHRLITVSLVALLTACTAATPPHASAPTSFEVGDIGPGGGTIFLVATEPFPCGVNLAEQCQFLEAAPVEDEVHRTWLDVKRFPLPTQVLGASRPDIGAGLENSLDISRHEGASTENSAAVYALNYSHGGKSDWFLPSLKELEALCSFAHGQIVDERSTGCGFDMSSTDVYVPPALMHNDQYWTSTEDVSAYDIPPQFDTAWALDSTIGPRLSKLKNNEYRVRPIRAF